MNNYVWEMFKPMDKEWKMKKKKNLDLGDKQWLWQHGTWSKRSDTESATEHQITIGSKLSLGEN